MITFAPPQKSFIANTPEANTQSLANYLLTDDLHKAKNISGSNMRKVLESFSFEITRAEQKLEELVNQYYPEDTINLIEEWERALSIPDECFKVRDSTTIEFRRKQVIAKLALMNLTTTQDFIDLAEFFDVTVRITSAEALAQVFPYTFPFEFPVGGSEALFIMVVQFIGIPEPQNLFPLTFPAKFDEDALVNLILCLFEKLKPAPVMIVSEFISN